MATLIWPEEIADPQRGDTRWSQAGSNLCLDFHGDPARAELVVFSDGNHHMALEECLRTFVANNHPIQNVFYVTLPPGPVLGLLQSGALRVGNLRISVVPHVLIGPPHALDSAIASGHLYIHRPLARSRGNVLLIRKGNPKAIRSVADIGRADVRLFMPNRTRETVSYSVYAESLRALANAEGEEFHLESDGPGVVHGEAVHHREAPQALADDRADVTLIFYHLALRYTRIFPGIFEFIPLGGSIDDPQPLPANRTSQTHIGVVGDGGQWGEHFASFMRDDVAGDIYRKHGLVPIAAAGSVKK